MTMPRTMTTKRLALCAVIALLATGALAAQPDPVYEDFEAYPVGSHPSGWATLFGPPGSVSTAWAYSGTKSFYLDNGGPGSNAEVIDYEFPENFMFQAVVVVRQGAPGGSIGMRKAFGGASPANGVGFDYDSPFIGFDGPDPDPVHLLDEWHTNTPYLVTVSVDGYHGSSPKADVSLRYPGGVSIAMNVPAFSAAQISLEQLQLHTWSRRWSAMYFDDVFVAPRPSFPYESTYTGAKRANFLGLMGRSARVGVIEAGTADTTHPALPRVTVSGTPNPHSHTTGVAGLIGGCSSTYQGTAPLAWVHSYGAPGPVEARAGLLELSDPSGSADVGVINVSYAYYGLVPWDLPQTVDYVVDGRGTSVVLAAGNESTTGINPLASSYNCIVVGGAVAFPPDDAWVSEDSSHNISGRCKPDIVAPSYSTYGPELGGGYGSLAGTSFAAPQVSGAVALLTETARWTADSSRASDPRVHKVVLLTSARKINNEHQQWTNNVDQPLDREQGAGYLQVDKACDLLTAGEQEHGSVTFSGWDLDTVDEEFPSAFADITYCLGQLNEGFDITATLTWNRHTEQGILGDYYWLPLANLDLIVYQNTPGSGGYAQVDWSVSTIDNVEHIWYTTDADGMYALRVRAIGLPNGSETYALAWTVVPEPATLALLAAGLAGLVVRKRRT